jgi:hypothetical protein
MTMSDWMNDNDPLALDFDPATVERRPSSFDPLPAGDYPFTVSKIEAKKTRDEQSVQANVELTVDDGEHKGRKVWTRITLRTIRTDEKGQQMLEIGKRQAAELQDACGVTGMSLSPCVGAQIVVKLKVRPAANGYEASNDVVAFKVRAGIAAPVAAASKPAASAPTSRPGFMARKG